MHANYPSPHIAARGENGLHHGELQLNFFTLPQSGTLKRGANVKYRPRVFTEQGVAMLSSVLRTPRAIAVNIEIMRAFVRLREALATNKELAKRFAALEARIEKRLGDQDQAIVEILQAIRELMNPPANAPKRKIGFV